MPLEVLRSWWYCLATTTYIQKRNENWQHGYIGPMQVVVPCKLGSLPWTRVAKQLFWILMHIKLAWTKAANLLSGFQSTKRLLAWTKVANQLFNFPSRSKIYSYLPCSFIVLIYTIITHSRPYKG